MNILLMCLFVFIFVIFIRMHIMIKKYKINFKYMFMNYVILIVIILVNIPFVTNIFMQNLSISNRFEIMTMIMFVYLMYNNFVLELHVARLNQDVEKIVSEIALIKKGNEDEK